MILQEVMNILEERRLACIFGNVEKRLGVIVQRRSSPRLGYLSCYTVMFAVEARSADTTPDGVRGDSLAGARGWSD